MLGAILKQVVSGWEHISQKIEEAFQMSKKYRGGQELEPAEILKLLISTLRTLLVMEWEGAIWLLGGTSYLPRL